MGKEASNSPISTRPSAYIVERMNENEEFLFSNARDAIEEVVELINDAIDNVGYAAKRAESKKDYVERSMAFFIYHVLMPFSYAIYVDLVAANLPVCFIELRLMLESLARCYLADLRYSGLPFFQERLKSLEQEQQSISEMMKELGRKVGVQDEFVILWGKLSQDWVHTQGFVNNVVENVIERSDIPPWALVVPMNYARSDLDSIGELRSRIAQFRNMLKIAIERYKQELGLAEK